MADALRRLGHSVTPFAWHTYIQPSNSESRWGLNFAAVAMRKGQNKYLIGPVLVRINNDLIDLVARERPALLFIYRGTHITAATLKTIREQSPGTMLVGYNNADPFAAGQPRWPWRHFVRAIPEYDRVLAYRRHNIAAFVGSGAKATGLLLPWFVPHIHRPVSLTADERRAYECDVVFVGHFEDDDRLPSLDALARRGVRVRVFGPGRGSHGPDWDKPLQAFDALRTLAPVRPVWGAEYTKALCGAKIALCFLSKRNRDGYTRRCFEGPATGTPLLSEHSPELATIF